MLFTPVMSWQFISIPCQHYTVNALLRTLSISTQDYKTNHRTAQITIKLQQTYMYNNTNMLYLVQCNTKDSSYKYLASCSCMWLSALLRVLCVLHSPVIMVGSACAEEGGLPNWWMSLPSLGMWHPCIIFTPYMLITMYLQSDNHQMIVEYGTVWNIFSNSA